MNIIKKFKIHISMFAVVPFCMVLGEGYDLFEALMIITSCEAVKVALGIGFGLDYKQICLTPIGWRCKVSGVENLRLYKKILFYCCRILTGLLILFLIDVIFYDYKAFLYISQITGVILFFNFMPVLPMDTGYIIFGLMEKFLGMLKAYEIMMFISNLFSILIVFGGFLYLILTGVNISLFLAGIFIFKTNKRELKIKKYKYCILKHMTLLI